ncbi:MAG: hypothetical protein OEQ53_18520 [Saprospiraceae bacterium]|nr:hypothetical protein [Saprospiraceae bacterium]
MSQNKNGSRNSTDQISATPKKTQRKKMDHSMVNQCLHDLKKWQGIMVRWEKEGDLLFKLVRLSTIGKGDESINIKRSSTALKNLFAADIKRMKIKLSDMSSRASDMQAGMLTFRKRMLGLKENIKLIAQEYDRLKHDILEELARCYPITMI